MGFVERLVRRGEQFWVAPGRAVKARLWGTIEEFLCSEKRAKAIFTCARFAEITGYFWRFSFFLEELEFGSARSVDGRMKIQISLWNLSLLVASEYFAIRSAKRTRFQIAKFLEERAVTN